MQEAYIIFESESKSRGKEVAAFFLNFRMLRSEVLIVNHAGGDKVSLILSMIISIFILK